jgi:hypothetical protein
VRIVVAGRLAATPRQGGASWAVLQWVLGFRALHHDVLLVEPAPPHPAVVGCFRDITRRYRLIDRAALLHGDGRTSGPSATQVARFAAQADVLVNLGGVLRDPDLLGRVAKTVYVDLDPAFTQVWHAQGIDVGLAGHDHHFSVGSTVGRAGSPVPSCGVEWRPVLPPVFLAEWPFAEGHPEHGFTTVGHWRSYGPITNAGVRYGQRAHSMRELLTIPDRARTVRLQPALGIHPDERPDIEALRLHGWDLLDPDVVAPDPDRYRTFVQRSTGELGIAKEGYVQSRSGWFSDRSACYLASGRPVVAQDTGWSAHLPAGDGLLGYRDAAEAAGALETVTLDYARHRRGARAIACAHLDSRIVLGSVLDQVGA